MAKRTHLVVQITQRYNVFWPNPEGWLVVRVLKPPVINKEGERCHYEVLHGGALLPGRVVKRLRGRRATVNNEFTGSPAFIGVSGWAYRSPVPRYLPTCPHGRKGRAGDGFILIPDEGAMEQWRVISVCRHELSFGR